jgi:hypothetical protein
MSKPYNIFISWSGTRSQSIAEALKEWIPTVLQSAKPWMSEADIQKGSRGLYEVSRALEGIKIGIICLTPENLDAPWIVYEAGALSKTIDDKTRVCTYLLAGLQFQNVKPPLGMFQHTKAEKADTLRLIQTINIAINEEPIPDSNLVNVFEKMWPDLEKRLASMPSPDAAVPARRPVDEMVAEILEISRAEANRRKKTDWMDQYEPVVRDFFPLLEQLVTAVKMGHIPGGQTGLSSAEQSAPSPAKLIFGVKIEYEDEIKTIEGTSAEQPHAGRLIVYDGNAIVADLNRVERWWREAARGVPK